MDNKIPVLSTISFSDDQLDGLRSISTRLTIRQQTVRSDRDDLSSYLRGDEEVIYGLNLPGDLSLVPHLNWLQLHSAGINRLVSHPLWKTEIKITTASGVHAVPIAEFVIGMMLAHARRFPKLFRLQERAEWPKHKWQYLLGNELRGKTIGIVGYGSIGREIARLAYSGFHMRVVAMKYHAGSGRLRFEQPDVGDPEGKIPDRFYARSDLSSMLGVSDYLILSLPLTRESRSIIGEPELRAMKTEGFLINISRGELIDEHALVRALKENWIAGAGLDAYSQEPLPRESQLWHCENAILSPHISAATPQYNERAVELFAQNLERYLDGKPLLNLVDRESEY